MGKEVERKFLVKKLPDLRGRSFKIINQGYVSTEPELRIRSSQALPDDGNGVQHFFTFKSDGDSALTRNEFETHITQYHYDSLRQKVVGEMITKHRYEVPIPATPTHKKLIAEVDVFHGHLEGLVMVEVEFPSEEAAKTFEPPPWFGHDMTVIPEYKNAIMSQKVPPIPEMEE